MSTTRPETMLGDVAVAVHPNDPRYQVRLQFFHMFCFTLCIVFFKFINTSNHEFRCLKEEYTVPYCTTP